MRGMALVFIEGCDDDEVGGGTVVFDANAASAARSLVLSCSHSFMEQTKSPLNADFPML